MIQAALKHHQANELQESEKIYRDILVEFPRHPDALHLLGVVAYQTGRYEESVELIQRALAVNSTTAEYHRNYGLALASLRRFDEAAVSYRKALQIKPNYPKCFHNLAAVLQPLGKLDEAIACCRRAIALQPNYPEVYNALGALMFARGDTPNAIFAYRKAIEQQPNYPQAYFNIGIGLQQQGNMDAAAEHYSIATQQRPTYAEAFTNLGVVLKMSGHLDEAMNAYQKALDLQPGNTTAHSNLIYLLQFHPDFGPAEIFARQQEWEQMHAVALKAVIKPHNNDRNPNRRIKIGYVSPDLRHHVVGTNLLPLLREHNSVRNRGEKDGQFEIICYASVEKPDSMSQRLQSFTDGWRDISKMSDSEAADLVRRDQIDILVDLTLHMADNRLLLFARKPAPVQVSYLGYCGGTGLTEIDYRISDPNMDPSEDDLKYYSEKTVRLANSYWCYQRPDPAPQTMPPPVLKNGYVTFGCMNNFAKVTAKTLDTWGRILGAVPNSKLIIHAQEGGHRQRVWDRMAEISGRSLETIKKDVEFVGKQDFWKYLQTFHRIDIVLDPFPYGGGITTCDGLWMGVPVITFSGNTAVGRGGRSILTNIGLPEWVAYSTDEYVQKAAELASDLGRLKNLRETMRERMLRSPLMDAVDFAREVEKAYREMWGKWCEGKPKI